MRGFLARISAENMVDNIAVSPHRPFRLGPMQIKGARIRSLWQRMTSGRLYKGECSATLVTWFLEVEDDGAEGVRDRLLGGPERAVLTVLSRWSTERFGRFPRLRDSPGFASSPLL